MQITSMWTYVIFSWKCKDLEHWLARECLQKISSCPWVKVFSSKGIPFDLDVDLKQQYSRPLLDRIPEGLLAEPRDGVCGQCGSMWSNELLNSKSLPLWCTLEVWWTRALRLSHKPCSHCVWSSVRVHGLVYKNRWLTFCPWETATRDQMTFDSKRPFHMHILSLLGMDFWSCCVPQSILKKGFNVVSVGHLQ